jgi:hypothetical protein
MIHFNLINIPGYKTRNFQEKSITLGSCNILLRFCVSSVDFSSFLFSLFNITIMSIEIHAFGCKNLNKILQNPKVIDFS